MIRRQSGAAIELMEQRLLLSGSVLNHEDVPAHPSLLNYRVAPVFTVRAHSGKTRGASKAVEKAAGGTSAGTQILTEGPFTSAEVSAAVATGISPEVVSSDTGGAPATAPFTPAEIGQFYSINSISFNGTAGTGAGQTIAIVDVGSDPGMVPSTSPGFDNSDLHNFDTEFNLPDPPSFAIYDQNGGTNYPAQGSSNDLDEISLDVEWAHAIAPAANIVLVEANSFSNGDLYQAITQAAAEPGVDVVSVSIGASEFSSEKSFDSDFTAPGVTYLASAGDSGSAATFYPAFSPNVIAVGGTSIVTSDSAGDYGSETVWNDNSGATGGGTSEFESRPSYQATIGISGTTRATPDVSFDADPQTGVYILEQGSYYEIGGTSLSCPCWAGLVAIADQGRSLMGLSALSGASQTLPRLYQLPSSDFNDITSGNNNFQGTGGYSATAGYDLASGLGTPIASSLVPDLAGGATLTGTFYTTSAGTYTPLASQTVYLDIGNRGSFNANDPTATTSGTGAFTFNDLAGGLSGVVRALSTPAGTTAVAMKFTTAFDTVTYADALPGDVVTAEMSATTAGQLQILVDGTAVYSTTLSSIAGLDFDLSGSGEMGAFDFANGDPVPSAGASLNGFAKSNGVTLSVLGTSGNDIIVVNAGQVLFNTAAISFVDVPNVSVDPRGGSDSLTVNAGVVTMPAQVPGGGFLTRTFSNLTIAAGATLRQLNAAADSDRAVLVVASGGLSISATGTLDLNANDMIVQGGNVATIFSLLASGIAGSAWTGMGIDSSAAAADISKSTALGMLLNDVNGAPVYTSFDGQTVDITDVLIKHTYYGDANLYGTVNADDYSLLDNGYQAGLTGWYNGDFSYAGQVSPTDYLLIDNGYALQSGTL